MVVECLLRAHLGRIELDNDLGKKGITDANLRTGFTHGEAAPV